MKLSKEAIKKEVPGANIRQLVLDLSSLAAVRKAAAEVNAYAEPLHVQYLYTSAAHLFTAAHQVLINNAAAPAGTFKLTVDNLETQIATDHIGPFLFTKLFVPKLLAARTERYTPRVVIVASLAHTFGSGIDLNMVANADPEKYKGSHNYFQAKSANILFGRELSQRAGGKLNAFSLHPGSA